MNSYTVTFVDWNGDVLKTESVNHGAGATAPADPTRVGYSFSGWNPAVFDNITADTTVTAQYSLNSYTVTFVDWNGAVLKTESVNHGDGATAPAAPSRANHSFTGWSPAVFTNITADTTVTAQYSLNSYTVTFVDWNGAVLKTESVNHGAGATAPADPTRVGYSFSGWNPAVFDNITAATTVTAQYSLNSYTVTFVDWNGVVLKTESVNQGNGATAPADPTRVGYSFTGWNPAVFTNITADTTVTAQYSINSYTVTFVDWNGDVLKTESVNHGSGATAPADPTRVGYSFSGWSPAVFTNITAATTVAAQYSQNSFTVTATLIGEGSVTPSSQQVTNGQVASFALNVAGNSYVQISSDCAANRSGNQIITAAIQANCSIALTVHPAIQTDIEDSSPAGSLDARRFRLTEGAGEQVLTALQQTRSGTVEWLDLADADTLLTLQDDGSYLFSAERTGRYTFEFTDAVSGELVSVSFDVLPYIAFTASSQPVQQGIAAQARVWLSDEPIDYPVRVTVMGEQAMLGSSNLELMPEDERRLALTVTATDSSDGELTIQADGLEQALLGTPHRQRLAVQPEQPPLVLQATVKQDTAKGLVIQQGGGLVELQASELNGVAAEFSWQAAELELSASGASANFNPTGLALGRYFVQLTAEAGERRGELELALNVVGECPVDDCSTTGVSGIPDSQNAQASAPNRLPLCPPAAASNRVQQCQGQGQPFVEVPNQYQLTLGLFSEQQSWQSGQFGAALTEGSLVDAGYQHLGFLVNMDVIGLESPGESVPVAIPMPAGQSIPANAVWRKLVNFVWQDFVEDEANRTDSAPRNALGNCPGVSSDAWRPGLNEGDACIRLTIEDGGPNDDDGRANGVIRDPGVLALQQTARISFDSAGGSAVADITGLVGSALTAPAAPEREGYTFVGWSPAFPETMPAEDLTLTAEWQINLYTIRFDVAGGQAINDLVLNFGAAISAPTPVRAGYTFTGWSPALPATMPATDLQVTAQWQPSSVTVTSKGGSLGLLSAVMLALLVVLRRLRPGKAKFKAVCASLLLLPMLAWSQDWYLGIQGGVANSHSSGNLTSAVERKLHAAGTSGTVTVQSNSDTGYRLFAGYRLNEWLAAELGWLDLGEAKLHYDGLPVSQPQATLEVQPQRGQGMELSLVGRLVLDEYWQPYARLALFDNRSRYQFEGPAAQAPERRSGIRLGAELGIGYQLNSQLQLHAAAAHYDTENFSTRLLSLGLRYSF